MKKIDPKVISNLCDLRFMAKAAAASFSDAVSTQAKLHEIPSSALLRFVCAKVDDKIASLDESNNDIRVTLTLEVLKKIEGVSYFDYEENISS